MDRYTKYFNKKAIDKMTFDKFERHLKSINFDKVDAKLLYTEITGKKIEKPNLTK